jgi:hypothetical protein
LFDFRKHCAPLIIENRWLLLLADEQVKPGMRRVQEIEDTREQIGEAGHAVEHADHSREEAVCAQRLSGVSESIPDFVTQHRRERDHIEALVAGRATEAISLGHHRFSATAAWTTASIRS